MMLLSRFQKVISFVWVGGCPANVWQKRTCCTDSSVIHQINRKVEDSGCAIKSCRYSGVWFHLWMKQSRTTTTHLQQKTRKHMRFETYTMVLLSALLSLRGRVSSFATQRRTIARTAITLQAKGGKLDIVKTTKSESCFIHSLFPSLSVSSHSPHLLKQ